MTDEQLINELRSGDQGIMDYIMDKYKSMVRKKARAMFLLGGENEDLIQEGMIGLIKAVRDYDPVLGNSFSSFAELCVSRQMYSAIEASKRKKHLPLNHYISLYEESENRQDGGNKMQLIDMIEPEQETDPEALYFSREYTEALVEQLKEMLSPLENHVLYLHLMGTDYKKIAEILEEESEIHRQCAPEDKRKGGENAPPGGLAQTAARAVLRNSGCTDKK